MRLVQVMVPTGRREAVVDVLDEAGVDYVLSDETSGREYTAVVSFPLPTAAVEPILEDLREAGLERDAYTVVVDAETVVSDRFERLEAAYEPENGDDDRIAREELATKAADMAPETRNFVVLAVVSAVVATAGLLLDSPAVVVGSMVIAPLLGPAIAASVGTVVDEDELFRRGVALQVAGGVVAVGSATLAAVVFRTTGVVSMTATEVFATGEVAERLTPDLLALPIAVGAGVAGALSLSSGVSAALVGVMIAAALVPPTAVVGIGLAWGRPAAVVGAGLLVVVNFLSINAAALGTLWYRGYRPESRFGFETSTATRRRLVVVGVALAATTALLAGATYAGGQTAGVETTAREETRRLLADQPGRLRTVAVHDAGVLVRYPDRVVVTVAVPLDATPPRIAVPVREAVRTAARDRFRDLPTYPGGPDDVTVRVEFERVQRAGG
ncbi:TIGR00341 family protein [Halobaculum sp. MBLA0147]|uniref:TIGR00341 family protein n=1 Tax=Halobaculum sp. MBLA0147 TaxID=3079934 RepID=UPI003526466D